MAWVRKKQKKKKQLMRLVKPPPWLVSHGVGQGGDLGLTWSFRMLEVATRAFDVRAFSVGEGIPVRVHGVH